MWLALRNRVSLPVAPSSLIIHSSVVCIFSQTEIRLFCSGRSVRISFACFASTLSLPKQRAAETLHRQTIRCLQPEGSTKVHPTGSSNRPSTSIFMVQPPPPPQALLTPLKKDMYCPCPNQLPVLSTTPVSVHLEPWAMIPYCPCPMQISLVWGYQKGFTALHLCALMVERVLHCLFVACCHILGITGGGG